MACWMMPQIFEDHLTMLGEFFSYISTTKSSTINTIMMIIRKYIKL